MINPAHRLYDVARVMPLIAILRGIKPHEALSVGRALYEAGIRIIEVPLNSPSPFESIRALTECPELKPALIGAGTVLSTDDVASVDAAGGRLIVSPNTDPAIIRATGFRGLVSLPGFQTASEAFAAIKAGAHGLKLFPAEAASPKVLGALKAVLPADIPVYPVGGIDAQSFDAWIKAGADGFGIGGALYKPGMDAGEVFARASALTQEWRHLHTRI